MNKKPWPQTISIMTSRGAVYVTFPKHTPDFNINVTIKAIQQSMNSNKSDISPPE